MLARTIYGKTIEGAIKDFFILSNRQLIKTKNQRKITFIYPCGDKFYVKITQVEQVPLIRRQPVWENHSSGTGSPDKETACLGKSLEWNSFP